MGPTLTELYASPVTRINGRANLVYQANYGVEYRYNSYGYRTQEFDQVKPGHVLVAGCSLTEGVGLPLNETWVYLLEQSLGHSVVNIAVGGSNAGFNSHNISSWIAHGQRPSQVIVQWPNVYRMLNFHGAHANFALNQQPDNIYSETLKTSPENFVYNWLSAVINTNRFLSSCNIPVINLFFDATDAMENAGNILKENNIIMHTDEKKPGSTWHFDSRAYDNSHHSLWCNEQWTERIVRILNESTTR